MEIAAIIVLIMFVITLMLYNKLVKLKNRVKQSESGIDIYLNQRFDLIPNLVECVKAYSKHEKEIFENITKLKSQYKQLNFQEASQINKELNKILVIAEGYPELKASEQYLNLQKNLVKIESQLQAARRIYNNDVMNYNTAVESIPTNIIAIICNFQKAELFQIEEYKRENIYI